jgi:glycerophosphoryl diester phosphodiesterase
VVIKVAALALLVAAAGADAAARGAGHDQDRGAGVALCQPGKPVAVLVAAHRGGALIWPENSLVAFRHALALGVDLLETDVHLSSDGEVIVLHDPTLERTTTGRGAVRASTRAELAGLRLRAGDGTPTAEPVPALEDVLAAMAATRVQLLLEIKVDAQRRRYPGIEAKVLERVRRYGLTARTVVMAFEDDTLRELRALDVAVQTALLVPRRRVGGAPPAAVVGWARAAGATHLGIDHRALDAALAAAGRAAGLGVAAWAVNDEASICRAIEHGADVVVTDRPDLALAVLGRRQAGAYHGAGELR